MAGIGQLQAFVHLLQSDAASAFISQAFGMIAVGYFTAYFSGTFAEMDMDKAGFGRGDAMLEGILYEGDEDERGYFGRAVGAYVYLGFHGDVGRQTDAHQFDVVADEIHFFAQGDEVLLIIVQHMAQKPAQFLDGGLCFVCIESDKGVDIVQRVEQEMRIQLVAQILQFGFRTALLGFAAGGIHLYPAPAHFDGCAQAHGKYHGKGIAQDEYPFGRPHAFVAFAAVGVCLEHIFLPQMRTGRDADNQ